MSEPAFDQLLRRLVEAGVEFVLVGGLAVNAWGVVRGTKDVDIVADPKPANLRRLAEVAAGAGGQAQQQAAFLSTPEAIAEALERESQLVIETELGRLDVVRGFPGMAPYDQLSARAVAAEILGVEVSVCSLEDLRAMKRSAGGTRDLADLEDLDAAHPQHPGGGDS